MRHYGIISTARMTGIRFNRKTAGAILEEFKILYKKYEVLNNVLKFVVLTSF